MRGWTIGVVIVSLLTGCASVSEKSREAKFDSTQRLYARTLEWSNFENLAIFHKTTEDSPPPNPEQYKDIKITSYQPGRIVPSADGKTMVRSAQIRYVFLARMSEKVLNVQEVWVYADEEARWYLKSGLPHF